MTAVTVYSNTALVTREVTVPDGAGLTEVVVSPLPPLTMQSSLYAEGNDNIRVLSVRYRTRAIAEDTREEVRKLDAEIKSLQAKSQGFEADLKAMGENLKLLDKLEGFTAKSLEHVTDKGQLDTEKIIALAKFVQDDRTKRMKEQLTIKQQLEAVQEKIAFTTRLLGEKSSGVDPHRARRGDPARQEGRGRHGEAELPRQRRRVAAAVQVPRRAGRTRTR